MNWEEILAKAPPAANATNKDKGQSSSQNKNVSTFFLPPAVELKKGLSDKEFQEQAIKMAKRRAAEAAIDRELNSLLNQNPQEELLLAASAGAQVSVDSDQSKIYGTEKDRLNCAFYLKIGSCRYGDTCSKFHPKPVMSETLLVKNMFDGLKMPVIRGKHQRTLGYLEREEEDNLADEPDPNDKDDPEVLEKFKEFFEDVHEEFSRFGTIKNFKVCRNSMHHLIGNVYVQFEKEEEALKAFRAMQGRFYGGKQIHMEFCPVKRWNTAICGQYEKTKFCPKGRNCNFLHVFRNPGDLYATYLGRDDRGAAIPPSTIDHEPFFIIDNEPKSDDLRNDDSRYARDREYERNGDRDRDERRHKRDYDRDYDRDYKRDYDRDRDRDRDRDLNERRHNRDYHRSPSPRNRERERKRNSYDRERYDNHRNEYRRDDYRRDRSKSRERYYNRDHRDNRDNRGHRDHRDLRN